MASEIYVGPQTISLTMPQASRDRSMERTCSSFICSRADSLSWGPALKNFSYSPEASTLESRGRGRKTDLDHVDGWVGKSE